MRKVLLYLLVGAFWLGVGLTPCSAEEGTLDSINVSVDFKSDTDLKYALQIISVLTGLSIIPDDDVTGKVTARFIDQPVSKVLERILEVNDCEYKLVDDIIRVVRIPVISKIFPLKFALAPEVKESLESLLLLSPKGTIQVDEEVNSLLVSDKRPYLEGIASFIQELDSAEKQLRSQSFSPQFLKAEKLASLIKDHLSSKGEIKIYPSTNSLLITETSFHMTKITSLVQSLDTFQPERKVFTLKFALASDMEKVIKGDLSPEGDLEVDEERNELAITDASYYLEKVGDLVAALDRPEKQIRKESFPIKYARIEDLALLLRENLSSKGNLEVDEERNLISIEDTSYHLFKLERLIQKEDSFIPQKKRYRIRFAPLTVVAEKAEEILSDKGELEIEEDTSSFVVTDVVKNLEKIEKLVTEADTLEAQLIPPLVFQDEDLATALETLSQTTGVSIVLDPGVEGKVNLIFGRPTALLKVLPQILEPNDCRYEMVGDTIRVIPIPLFKRIFPLKFALASEVAASVESLVLLSPKGSIKVDEEVNSLLVSDKRPYLEEIASFIQELDSPQKQLRSKTFSPQFLKAERLASLIKDHLSDNGEVVTYPSTNSLLITETSFHMTKITSLIQGLDTFQPEKKVFPFKFALASDMEKIIKGYLSPEGSIQVNEERNELAITDASYYLEKVGDLVADLDRPEKQIREESFLIKYARIEDLGLLLRENLSSKGNLEVDEERSLINIEDTSYYLSKLRGLIQEHDSFIPKKKRYRIRFAPLVLVAEKAEEILSDKGTLEIQEDTSSFLVTDVEKNLEKIEELVRKMDTLEAQLIPPLSFEDEDLTKALHTLSRTTGVSMVVDPGVEGKVNLSFGRPIALVKVLPQILQPNHCRYEIIGDTIRVVPIPLFKRIFPLKFALASEVRDSVNSLFLLSPKGTLQVDEEANSLLVSDKRPYMEGIASFIQELDSPEKQLRSKTFSPQFLKAERLASLIKDQLTDKGKIDIDPSTNSLLITETSFHLTRITSLVESMDTFQPERKVFPLKFALASDMEKITKGYLSPEGDLEVDEERNELAITDASYYLEKIGNLVADLDTPEKQIRKESFPIKYARIEDLAPLLRENLSSKGNLEVDEERSLISIEDSSYYLSRLGKLIQEEDSFIPKKKRYRIRFAPLILVAEKAEEVLSDKGNLEIQEDTSSFLVTDVEKNLEKIEKLVGKMDNLEDELVTKKYFLTYLTPEEARPLLQVLMTDYGEIRLPRMQGKSEESLEKEEYVIIPQEEPTPREAVSERVLKRQLSEPGSEELPSLEESEKEGNVIYVTDLKRNISNIDELITYLNGAETAAQIITKTFYIKEGSLERMALAMANILGISPDDIEGLEPKGEWMQMKVPTLEINLGTVGPK